MSLPDMAEYWWDIKRPKPMYMGREFYHIPNIDCGHRHLHEAKRVDDVNCFACLKLIEEGFVHGLPDGKTDFRTRGERKRDRMTEEAKIEREKLGKCSCGCQRVKRFNSLKKSYFLGCSNYPKCRITSVLLNGL